MSDPQRFAFRVLLSEAAGEELARGREAIELQGKFGTLTPHAWALTKLGSARDLNRVDFGG
jgi:hypothetical protein